MMSGNNTPLGAGGAPEYREFHLVSAGVKNPHHIMRVPNPKFDVKSLKPPVRLVRQQPKPRENGVKAEPNPPDQPTKEKMDPSRVAPWGGAVKNRQNLFKKKTKVFTSGREDPEAQIREGETPAQRKRRLDPDRHPWVLSDAAGKSTYTGNVENSKNTYMLFVLTSDGFKVVPASRIYKFTPNIKYKTLTADEVEEQMKKAKRYDPWMMHKKQKAEGDESNGKVQKEGKGDIKKDEEGEEKKDWRKKFLGEGEEDAKKSKRRRKREIDEAEELDFDEEFADDEHIELGIDDPELEKEASRRQFGKLGRKMQLDDADFDDWDDERKPRSKGVKKLTKVLNKMEKTELYGSDEDNPYISDVEDEDEEEELEMERQAEEEKKRREAEAKAKKEKAAAADKKGKGKTPSDRPGSSPGRPAAAMGPSSMVSPNHPGNRMDNKRPRSLSPPRLHAHSPHTPSPLGAGGTSGTAIPKVKLTLRSPASSPLREEVKRKRPTSDDEDVNKKIKREDGIAPPTPEAAARDKGTPARTSTPGSSSRGILQGKASAKTGTPSTKTGTPISSTKIGTPVSNPSSPAPLLKDEDVIEFLKSRGGSLKVKDIITNFRTFLTRNPANKNRIREIMKRVGNHDKETGVIVLKEK
ncbi:hypothetical protein HK104_008329 [Borealophlyctis nickersoniae]|nr:hypothetical protein HK104_008329 [Borealophlyctis nickersoniae]